MKREIYALFVLVVLLFGFVKATAQVDTSATGFITGKVIDKETQEPLLANLLLLQNGVRVTTKQADFEGNFKIGPVKPGTYDLKIMYIGYSDHLITGVIVKQNKTVTLPVIEMYVNPIKLEEVIIIKHKDPAFERDQTTTGEVLSRKDIRTFAVRKIDQMAATSGGTVRSDKGFFSKGGRSNSNVYYVDGIRLPGTSSPQINAPDNTRVQTYNSPENYDRINENDWQKPSLEPLSTFSIDVDAASYSNMRRFIKSGQLPPKDAVRIEEMINYFKYNYDQPKEDVPFAVFSEMAVCPWNKDHKIVHIGLQGKIVKTEDLPSSNLVFLIDVSGSMSDVNKLPLVRESLKLLVNELRPNDKVAIVVYAGAAGLVLPSTNANDKNKIISAINSLEAGGSTAGGAGINLAYKIAKENFIKDGNNRVILATDGDFNVGQSSEGELTRLIEEKRKDGIFLTVLGYGTGNYQDSKMQQLADKGNGNHAYIDDIFEAKKVLVNEFGGTLFTIAKDVKLQVEWNPALVKGYRLIGYENRMLNKEDFNDDKKDAGELGSGHTVTALYEIIPASSKETIEKDVDSLKYQFLPNVQANAFANEIYTLKLRYKKPDEEKSKLITYVLNNSETAYENASENLRWSVSVAAFGLLLRDSQFKGNLSYKVATKWAKNAKGKDEEGYRSEFIKLMETAEIYSRNTSLKE